MTCTSVVQAKGTYSRTGGWAMVPCTSSYSAATCRHTWQWAPRGLQDGPSQAPPSSLSPDGSPPWGLGPDAVPAALPQVPG